MTEVLSDDVHRQTLEFSFQQRSQVFGESTPRIPGEDPCVADETADQDSCGLESIELTLYRHVGDAECGRNSTRVPLAVVLEKQQCLGR